MPHPVFVVTGTPGTGKSTFSRRVAKKFNLIHLDISELAMEKKLWESYDSVYKTYVINDDAVVDELERRIQDRSTGVILDYHSCSLFPRRWVTEDPRSAVLVLQCPTEILFDRLTRRGYKGQKLTKNMEAEIMCTCEGEARENYPKTRVFLQKSCTLKDLTKGLTFIANRLKKGNARV